MRIFVNMEDIKSKGNILIPVVKLKSLVLPRASVYAA